MPKAVNLKTLKTGHWKNARTKEYGEKARASYLRISKRSSTITR
jgi:hypothetical protein